MSRVFLSHSSRNSAEAVALKRWLVEQDPGLADEIFLDLDRDTGIAPGERWKRALRQANERCEVVLCLLSAHWQNSSESLAEYRTAETLGKLILCARLEPLDTAGITGEWQHCDLFGDGPATEIPVDEAGRSVCFQTDGLRRLYRGLRRAGIGADQFAWPPPDDPERACYRGWEPLDESDAAVFFGRDAQIIRGMDALRGMRASGIESLFVVLGPSGVGKSSFLRAGLLPRIRRDDRHFLVAGIVRPGRDALTGDRGLARSIHHLRIGLGLNHPALGDIKEACLRADAAFLTGLLAEARQTAGQRLLDESEQTPLPTVVLPLDQAEELFSADAGPQAPRFLSLLAQLLGPGDGAARGMVAACTIRTDFFGSLQDAPQLSDLKSVVFDELRPMPPAHFREVILGPAARSTAAGRALVVQADLVERLQSDSSHGADSLPLLSLTLARLYEDYGDTGQLTLDGYEAMGGMGRVVQTQVDAVLARDPVVRKSQLHRLRSAFIPWLATINPDNDQPVRRVARLSDLPADARPEIDALVATRLLVQDERDGEVFVEVALESLLRQWGELAGWLEAERGDLKEADNLERAAAAWEQNQRNPSWLLEGERLERAESMVAKPGFRDRLSHTMDFLFASRAREYQRMAQEERHKAAELHAAREKQEVAEAHAATLRRRSRILRAVLAGTAVVALAAVIGFVLAVAAMREASDRARETTALMLAAEGQARLAGARPGGELLGMQQMLASRALMPTTEGDRALASSVVVQHDVYKMIPVGSPVRDVAYAPDGRLVASGDDGGAVRLWDAGTGQPAGEPLLGHAGVVRAVAFSPDGRRLASAGDDGTVRLWDTGTGQPVGGPLTGHGQPVRAVAFSPDGRRLASGGADGSVRLWDAGSARPLGEPMIGQGPVNAVAISPAGRLIATGGDDGAVRLWNASTGQPVAAPMTGHAGAVHAVAFDPAGERIASAGHDRTVRLWDADSARPVGAPLTGHKNWVSDVAFSPDGQRLVSASADYNLLLWDPAAGQSIGDPLTGHGHEVFSAAFSPDGERIVSGMGDGTVRVWDARAPVPMLHGLWVLDLDVSDDGALIASTGVDKIVRLWDTGTEQPVGGSLAGHQDVVHGVAFSPDGTLIATASADRTVRLWDVATRRQLGPALAGHDGAVLDVAFSPDGTLIATAGADQTVRLWDVAARRQRGPALAGHEGAVNAVAFSPDGALAASAGADGTVRLWEVETGRAAAEPLSGHGEAVLDVAFSPDGALIASGGEDKMVRLWDARSRRQQGPGLAGHEAAVRSVAFSPDSRRVASGGDDWQVRLWDAGTGAAIGNPLIGHWDVVDGLAFTPDNATVVSGSWDRTVRTWPVPPDAPGALCSKLTQNLSRDQWLESVSPDVDYVATCPDLPVPDPAGEASEEAGG
ncbi:MULTISPECIES: TIR domain-containing protein [Micrococcaceae]|uniref:nSTAND1 domain-containing NTPase n=1 Tax=Micrococcaceae TaxID=1268 RepID=UPI00161915B6|nr:MULTISPECIES: TIR domain-containing protein [Micrococcaceae]MBB5748205.1 WD40 repeat protein [Micrococcus sp. TA1]HRO30627.1 TIR domain-containing protein [Citricoccus sp.]HRO94586.1 TIR domain-containing protein [Citricoccus sp.]